MVVKRKLLVEYSSLQSHICLYYSSIVRQAGVSVEKMYSNMSVHSRDKPNGLLECTIIHFYVFMSFKLFYVLLGQFI